MKSKLTLLTLAAASLLVASTGLAAGDPVPPTPPVNPPAGTPAAAKPEGAAKADGAARPERGPGGQRGDRLAMMKDTLGLTAEQVEKIKPILDKDREKMMALREDAALSREQKAEKMKEIFTASTEQIKPILTPEQLEKWNAQMEKRKQEMEKRRAEQEKK